ncbi:hypothetical protein BKA81DRAFT_365913 [Phyllosticta paracitricarpa]
MIGLWYGLVWTVYDTWMGEKTALDGTLGSTFWLRLFSTDGAELLRPRKSKILLLLLLLLSRGSLLYALSASTIASAVRVQRDHTLSALLASTKALSIRPLSCSRMELFLLFLVPLLAGQRLTTEYSVHVSDLTAFCLLLILRSRHGCTAQNFPYIQVVKSAFTPAACLPLRHLTLFTSSCLPPCSTNGTIQIPYLSVYLSV